MSRNKMWAGGVCLLLAALAGCGIPGIDPGVEVVEFTDYNPPKQEDDGLADDRLEDKKTTFDPNLVDRRLLGDWRINQSEAVIKLDVPLARPDSDGELLVLRPSYIAALDAAKNSRPQTPVLPSVNLLDGKAKQFDDGLYAAIDLAYFQGLSEQLPSHLSLLERLLGNVPADSPAAAYLAAGLTLGGRETKVANDSQRDKWMREFNANPALAKPIGFYTWSEPLKQCWRCLRFLQQDLKATDPVVTALVQALASDPALKADYEKAAQFYGKLTNPLARLTLADLVGVDAASRQSLEQLRKSKSIRAPGVAFFPPSSTRESELFERLFPLGVPQGANLMKELVSRIRSGEVDLTPNGKSGWYDYQVYALETMLLPEKGEEHNKLLLLKPYKKRMLEAFAALITKRRETHARMAPAAKAAEAAPALQELNEIRPRLRVEPCPSYFLRTARSYSFLREFLNASLGETTLRQLKGLREGGERAQNLAGELNAVRELFYGVYLVSCEDIGQKPALREGELANADQCYNFAVLWLEKLRGDTDLAQDTRVAVPIYVDPLQKKMRLWVTLGVRLTQLDARFVTPPRLQPAAGEGDWKAVESWKLLDSNYLIPVDEFAEVEVATLSPPNRDELRKLCDQHKTKEAIVAALQKGKW